MTINDKSIDGVLGGGRMEGADESTELWRHPLNVVLYIDLTNQANEKAKSSRRYLVSKRSQIVKIRHGAFY